MAFICTNTAHILSLRSHPQIHRRHPEARTKQISFPYSMISMLDRQCSQYFVVFQSVRKMSIGIDCLYNLLLAFLEINGTSRNEKSVPCTCNWSDPGCISSLAWNSILTCMVVIAFILVLRLGYDKSLEWNKIARALTSIQSNPPCKNLT
jgi:hypothetical protein